mmetsp:Transcript_9293/g.13949  ORF Transcript_9293/g.13949 Transcript_9293/m.13949 type:complete len:406 (-) Transcript_9293:123-1340(-)|eukprot:CAMPEP_0167749956 /NCGR_PEP_ID=MMETSP0110_2-20121227/5713_1 /TAXON_ID=629695 /ORGANISM="Gymnochlora sp., Strain CCMP2014" /LENGTH=405 /DNA_ID=CAMNT_0007635203 /DNA_START=89 /DNA_END=1306 /DNA_ORIENTATION=-
MKQVEWITKRVSKNSHFVHEDPPKIDGNESDANDKKNLKRCAFGRVRLISKTKFLLLLCTLSALLVGGGTLSRRMDYFINSKSSTSSLDKDRDKDLRVETFAKDPIRHSLRLNNASSTELNGFEEEESDIVPERFLQFGRARTATTFQFTALCLMVHMYYPDREVFCGFMGKWNTNFILPEGVTKRRFFHYAKEAKIVLVLKTHFPQLFSLTDDLWMFTTSHKRDKDWKTIAEIESKKYKLPVKYVQTMGNLREKGYKMVADYQEIFKFSDEQVMFLMEYLRYWTVLRQCCGCQMSSDRKKDIVKERRKRRWRRWDPLYPACEIYNISEVEIAFLGSQLYKKHGHRHIQLRSISDQDGSLNGTYCKRFLDHFSETKNMTMYIDGINTCVGLDSFVTYKLPDVGSL